MPPKYVPDSEFPKTEKNRMIPMKKGRYITPIFPDGQLHPERIRQSEKATCWILGSLIAFANRNPQMIKNLFTDNGDGTVTIHFTKVNNRLAYPDIRIDKTLPNADTSCPDWVRLLEKGLAANGVCLKPNAGEHPEIAMENLNWGYTEHFVPYIDRNYNEDTGMPDVVTYLEESKDKEELIRRFTEFCNKVTERNGSIMIQTAKHNMSVSSIENGIIHYYDQLSNKSDTVSIDSLFNDKSNFQRMVFSVQGQKQDSIMILVDPKEVWHRLNVRDKENDNDIAMVSRLVESVLNGIAYNMQPVQLNFFGEGCNIKAFAADDKCMDRLLKDFQCENSADLRKVLRNPDSRVKLANEYFDFLEKAVPERRGVDKEQFKQALSQWRFFAEALKNRSVRCLYDEHYLDSLGTVEQDQKTYEAREVKFVNTESRIKTGKTIIRSEEYGKDYIKDLNTMYRAAKSWSGTFGDSDEWKSFRHSLHTTANLAKAVEKNLQSTKQVLGEMKNSKEEMNRFLEQTSVSISELDKEDIRYVKEYCLDHGWDKDVEAGKLTYTHLCEILGSSWEETQTYAKKYEEYKTRKLGDKTPDSDDVNKLKLVGIILNEKKEAIVDKNHNKNNNKTVPQNPVQDRGKGPIRIG